MLFTATLIQKIADRESDPMNRARVLMSFYLVLAYFLFAVILIGAYSYTNQTSQLIRAVVIAVFSLTFLLFLYYFNSWRVIFHFVLICITVLGVWANLLIFVNGINVPTVQYIWLASALGFYMFGYKWGWFYTIVNIIPVLIDASFSTKEYFFLSAGPQVIARPIYVFVITFGFISIAFLHFFFFKAFNRNIISLTRTKNKLNKTNEQLNKKVAEINQLSNARMNFLSTMSHELRTPLNGVIGLTNVLLLQDPRKDQEETLAVLQFSAENLLSLINDILDFNKLDSEMVELERIPFNLTNLISNIYSSTQFKAVEKRLHFILEIEDSLKNMTLVGDPTRLTQVLLNLINNSIKFTEQGEIKLNCSCRNLTDNHVKIRLSIADTGIGIAKNQQERIFDDFVQASGSTTRKFGGTGLGLSIVKKVLTLHKTKMHLTSTLGRGTTLSFDIVFPFQSALIPRTDEKSVSDLAALELGNLKILLVEDNAINIMVVTKILKRIGIKVDVAENGRLALDRIAVANYDLILMDLYMPELDGYETTKCIRQLADPKKSTTPIIAITATVNNKMLAEVIGVGMNGYLSKPFHPNDLFDELRKYVV